ncbi:MAG: hypothetical protein J6Q38_02410 [Clostridia bacterium]|nr:hypothetical protein [Clostridia bacterium]
MAKKQLNEYELHLKHNKNNFCVFWFAVIVDLLLLFYFLGGLTDGKFLGFYALHAFVTSNVLGVLATLLACNSTKSDYDGRQFVNFLVIGKIVINLLSNVIGVLCNPNWHTSDGERAVFQSFIIVAVIALLAYSIQLYLCQKLTSKYKCPKEPKGTYGKAPDIIITDRVKETQFYKEKHDKYYREYMGLPPRGKGRRRKH